MQLSTIILSFNSEQHLERSIGSLIAALGGIGKHEIFVIDNGSTDRSVSILKRFESLHPELLRVIYLERNTGTTASRNLALRKAAGRYVLIMDSDVEVPDGTIEYLMNRLDADRKIGIIAPRLNYPDGRLQMSVDVFPTVTRKLQRYVSLKAMEDTANDAHAASASEDVDYAISAFWLMRREILDSVGLLDERIFYSPEDVDYCLRVWEAGLRVVYDPAVHAIHDARERSRGFSRFTLRHACGLAYLYWKHRFVFSHTALYRRLGRSSV